LIALGTDLVLAKQAGMSLGLRFLLDRDDGHIAVRPSRPPDLARSLTAAQFFLQNPYKPSIRTIAILGGSLGLMSAL
jgi:hypothetical protein